MGATKNEVLGREFVRSFRRCGRCNGDGWYAVHNGADDFDYITCSCPDGKEYERAEKNGEL